MEKAFEARFVPPSGVCRCVCPFCRGNADLCVPYGTPGEQSPVYSAAKSISLASAAVSILTLGTAMITVFGQENDEPFHQVMLGTAGMAVVLFIQDMAIYMVVTANRSIRIHNSQTLR